MKIELDNHRVPAATDPTLKIIRYMEVSRKLGISPASLFEMIARAEFPRPFRIIPNGRSVGWLEQEVDDWIIERRKNAQEVTA